MNSVIEAIKNCLEDLPDFPCRVDEMTSREYEIAKIATNVVGTLQYVLRILEEDSYT
jgi:hypothetical protein